MKLVLAISILVSLINAQGFDQLFVGARPLSMGGAFVALADDGNVVTWNPAGLPRLRRTEFTLTYTNLYNLGINQSYFGFTRPIIYKDKMALGFDWLNNGFDDGELGYSENKLNFSLGYQPHRFYQ